MSNSLLIYFDDLTKDCQQRMLDYFGIDKPEEMNWDEFAVTIVDSQYKCEK